MHEATGLSPKSWDAAVLAAIADARKEIEGEIIGFEVVRLAGDAGPRSIRTYRASVRVAYRDRVVGPKSAE
jgi:flavin-binding protein dodecin